jgi:capsular exopolysaccharide synthesis family protein
MDPLRVPAPQETKLHFLDYWRIIRIRKTVILAVFLLVVITATLVTFILPESYSSMARIKVERDQSDVSFLTDPRMGGPAYDPYFIQNEFETIKSERVLTNVVANLNLNDDWGKKYNGGPPLKTYESVARLRAMMDLQPVRNTSFIDVKVYSEKPDEAAGLANAVASAYQIYRLEMRKQLSLGGVKALEERWKEQEDKIHAAQTNLDRLREKLGISDAIAAADAPTMLMSAEMVRKLQGMRIELEATVMQQETLLEKLKSMSRDKLIYALPTATPDQLLNSLLEQRNYAEQALLVKQKDFGESHPEVVKLQAQVGDLKTKIDSQVDGILMGLDSRVSAVREQLNKLKDEVEKAKTNDIATASQTQPYWEAKRKLEDLQRFSQVLQMKIMSEKIEASLPKTTMVEIMDDALPGIRPVKPNKPFNIALGIIIGLVVGVGLAFFIEYLDTSVKTIDDVERSLQSPVLGVIPQNVGLVLEEGVDSPHAEAYRVLRTNILFSRKDEKLNTVAVVSAGAGEGKSTTVFNLACVFAQSKQRTLIVDSDLRRPTLHKMLGISNNLGLTNYLMKQNTLEEVIQTTDLPTLDFLASGKLPSSSLGILSSLQMKDLINELKRRYDFVFFDSPPIMGVSDASILASEVDMTLQVIQYRRYPQPMNIRAKQLIEKVGGNLVGIVLNNINMSQDESYYYYSGYYHDYYSRNDDQEPAARAEGDKTGHDETKA